jgi:hypothetical protein
VAKLTVVPPGSKPPRREPKSISAALDGSSRDVLAAMRRALAKKLDAGEVSSNSIASAYKELRELDRLIRTIDARNEDGATGASEVEDGAFDTSAV